MDKIYSLFNHVDQRITALMARYSIPLMRISLGINFLWFGLLKFFPGLSPAQGLAGATIERLTFGAINEGQSLLILAVWETLIGLGLLTGLFLRGTLFLLFVQMLGTLTPLFLFPAETFTRFPYAPTLEGQYILKNLVLISAGLAVGATVRGGKIVAERKVPSDHRSTSR